MGYEKRFHLYSYSYSAAVERNTICGLFGVIPATLSRLLQNAEYALTMVQSELQETRIKCLRSSSNMNGLCWLHAIKVMGVVCYRFDGTLVRGRHNHPGSWNDGEMSRRLQLRLADARKTIERQMRNRRCVSGY
ncbi:hypothetical protein PHMEG_00035931 [Phytophthora megakarya]|uniref:Uncharacterized protein n=1 Tax=Phytophthora megakarya TaxID=4795 RepID=A0A225UMN1_9STRA|nr:hypothetical protein PHMEG_00035931 [Phytophthora megakarya]